MVLHYGTCPVVYGHAREEIQIGVSVDLEIARSTLGNGVTMSSARLWGCM